MNSFIGCELDTSSKYLNSDIRFGDWLFSVFKLIKNADRNKYGYSGYGIGFDARSSFFSVKWWVCKDVILFGVDNICSAHADNRYLVFVEGPIDEIDDTINSSKSWKMYTAVFIC